MRRLFFPQDEELYREAYGWDQPAWLKEYEYEPFEKFVGRGIDVGVFDGELIALIQLEAIEDGIFELHFTARRDANPELLIQAGSSLRSLFEYGAKYIYAWVLRQNVPMLRIDEACGMVRDGATMIKGKYESVRLIYTEGMYGQEKNNTTELVLLSDAA